MDETPENDEPTSYEQRWKRAMELLWMEERAFENLHDRLSRALCDAAYAEADAIARTARLEAEVEYLRETLEAEERRGER